MFYRWNIQQARHQDLQSDILCLSQGPMMPAGMRLRLHTFQVCHRAVDSNPSNQGAHPTATHVRPTDGKVRHYLAAALLPSPLTYQGQVSLPMAVVHQLRSAHPSAQRTSDREWVHSLLFLVVG